MPWNWKSDRCRTPMSWGIDVASERPKTAATSSASVGAILAMIIVSCTGAPAALGGKDRSNSDDAREATAPPASAARAVLERTRDGCASPAWRGPALRTARVRLPSVVNSAPGGGPPHLHGRADPLPGYEP